jgi:hypothetical protein
VLSMTKMPDLSDGLKIVSVRCVSDVIVGCIDIACFIVRCGCCV